MRLRKNSLLLIVYGLLFPVLFSGCGYTTGAVLPDNIKTIHVEIFRNSIDISKEISAKDRYEIYRPGLEVDLRDNIVERIFLDGHLKAADKNRADAILEGEITKYRKDPLRYQNEIVREFRISLVCDIKLRKSSDSKILVEERNITGDTTFFTSGSLEKSEEQALKDAMQDLARRIVNRVVENW